MRRHLAPLLIAASAAALAAAPAQNARAESAAPAEPAGAKAASSATATAQRRAAASLPRDDGRDAAFAARGFVATRADPLIRAADGRVVWDLAAYDWIKGAAPDTVNPSLWRHMGLLKRHGLFKVADGVWQVRGFDVSNMTVIAGRSGWIVVDPLTSVETARAALALVNETLGARPVAAVIYSHSHGDHFGGVRGVVDAADVAAGKVAVLAPAGFTEEAASENVLAGGAMGRRAVYQFGASLEPGPRGRMGSGIGAGLPRGEITLVEPTDTIARTGETRVIDGVNLEFQIVSGTEAPAEMNVYIAPARAFLAAEIATCTLHNILTPRGAKVRDALLWAQVLDEAARVYGPRSDVALSSHCWPRFGREEASRWLAAQRDNYRYLHDQTVRAMNQGASPVEIAEGLRQPDAIGQEWFNRGYYGTYSHNAKAIYQHYLGWYDAVPANLDPHPPVERARRLVATIGGADKVLAAAQAAMDAGDYRWSSDLLNSLVFAEPADSRARALLADSYEQQGYQAESAIWRNQFLSAARELREGVPPAATAQSPDLIAAIPTALLLDSVSTRYDPAALGWAGAGINLVLTDRDERVGIEAGPAALIGRVGAPLASPDATITAPRRLVLGLFFLKLPLSTLEAAGLRVEGNRAAVEALQGALDPLPGAFAIAEP